MRLILAPMEGVVDYTMRDLLTRIGGYDRCVTEFVRVSREKLPPRVFYRACPELLTDCCTPVGVPIYVQLLGGCPSSMARNAQVAARLGARGIDLNFGCPSKVVNHHDGGSALLREPQRVQESTWMRVLIAKDAISTGWDCPRAEVMVSFRAASHRTKQPSAPINNANRIESRLMIEKSMMLVCLAGAKSRQVTCQWVRW